MTLDQFPVGPVIPVSDLGVAKEFYEDALGLSGDETPGGYVLRAGGGTTISSLEAPEAAATRPTRSQPSESMTSPSRTHAQARGVPVLTDADLPFHLNEDDVSSQEGMAVAWFKDPFGQVLTLFSLG